MGASNRLVVRLLSAYQLCLALCFDDFLLNVRRNLRVLAELHRERPLALGHAAQVGRIAERFGQWDFRSRYRNAVTHVGVGDQPSTTDDVADD